MTWRSIDTAPRDGTSILVARFDGCGWEYAVVWWGGRCTYPWSAVGTAYPEDRFDYWAAIRKPHDDHG